MGSSSRSLFLYNDSTNKYGLDIAYLQTRMWSGSGGCVLGQKTAGVFTAQFETLSNAFRPGADNAFSSARQASAGR